MLKSLCQLLSLIALLAAGCSQSRPTPPAPTPTLQPQGAVAIAQRTREAIATERALAPTVTPRPAPTERPEPTPTLPIPSRAELAASLVGQTVRFCRDHGVGFDGVVEEAYALDHVLDGLRIDLVVRAANVGAQAFGTFQLTQLEDERGRHFDQAGLNERIDGLDTARRYQVDFHGTPILPGFSGRQAWSFVVAPDVRQLTVVPLARFPCTEVEQALAAPVEEPAGGGGPAASLVGQGFTFCRGEPISFELSIERATQQPAQGGIQVNALVRAANVGSMPRGTYLLIEVVDERGRRYGQLGTDRSIDLAAVARTFGASRPQELIKPGQTSRQVWAFLVPTDVHTLTLVEREIYSRCSR